MFSFSRIRRAALASLAIVALAAPLVAAAPTAADQPAQAQAVNRLAIAGTDTDSDGRRVTMREGIYLAGSDRGFGWTEIRVKHAIFKKSIIGFVLKNPNGGTLSGKHKRIYRAVANRAECSSAGNCQVVEQRGLVTVVDNKPRDGNYHTVKMRGKRAGVVTTYCKNPNEEPECPSWVNESVNAPARSDEKSLTTLWTYKPITETQLDSYEKNGRAPDVGTL